MSYIYIFLLDTRSPLNRYNSPTYCDSVRKECKSQNNKRPLGFRIRYEPEEGYSKGRREASSLTNKNKHKKSISKNSDDNDCKCLKKSSHSMDYSREKKSYKSNMQTDKENIHKQIYTPTDAKKFRDNSQLIGDLKSTDIYMFRDFCKEMDPCKDNANKRNLRNTSTDLCDKRKYVDKYIKRHNRSKCFENKDSSNYCNKKWTSKPEKRAKVENQPQRCKDHQVKNTIQPEKRVKVDNQSQSCKNYHGEGQEYCSCEKIQIQVEADESFELKCHVKDISEDTCICSDNEEDDRDTYYTSLACSSTISLGDMMCEPCKQEPVNR